MEDANLQPAEKSQPIFMIGTSGWTYEHWKGCFYPPDLSKSRWFEHYASQFHTVEVNATFYRSFSDETYGKWRERAPQGFGYVLKAPQLITHRKYLLDVEAEIASFYRSCCLLEDRFEMILLQVAPNMPVDLERLQKALQAFPDPGKVAVEFRRLEWFCPETLGMLHEAGAAMCNPDSPRHRLTDHLTSKRAYLRLHGRKQWYACKYTQAELDEIAALAMQMADRGASTVYIFFNNDYEGFAPENARTLQQMLGVK